MRPVEFIWEETRGMILKNSPNETIIEHLRSPEFEARFKEHYPYSRLQDEQTKLFYELGTYKKVLAETRFRTVYGEDGSLQYYHMCQRCGNILHDPHDEMYVTDHDMMCPTCNELDVQTFPYTTIPLGSLHWISLVRTAAANDSYNEKHPDKIGYVAGSAKDLAYNITRWMAFKWWVFVRWSRVRAFACIILHPRAHIAKIRKRNAWRREMEIQ